MSSNSQVSVHSIFPNYLECFPFNLIQDINKVHALHWFTSHIFLKSLLIYSCFLMEFWHPFKPPSLIQGSRKPCSQVKHKEKLSDLT